MNAPTHEYPKGDISIRTFWNRHPGRTERRVLRNGRWVRLEPQIVKTLNWLRGAPEAAALN